MKKEYSNQGIDFNFSEEVSDGLIKVELSNNNSFEDLNETIMIDKDGQFTELDVVHQIQNPEFLEGIDTDELTEEVAEKYFDHSMLNLMAKDLDNKISIASYRYDLKEDIPQVKVDLEYQGDIYDMYLPLYEEETSKGKVFTINSDPYEQIKLNDLGTGSISKLEEKVNESFLEEAVEHTLNKKLIEIDEKVGVDSDFIKEERKQSLEKEAPKKKRSQSLGMSM